MKRFLALTLAIALAAGLPAGAQAACYADYKARRDNPLKLHYGVIEVSACDAGRVKTEVATRLAQNGWTLLNVLSVFDESGLEQRKADAGNFYLRF